MKILHIDPIFGISGDMMISALVDAGASFDRLAALMKSIPSPLPPLTITRKSQGIIEGTRIVIGHSDLHFSLKEMRSIITNLPAPEAVRENALAMLAIIAKAEAKVHKVPVETVHLHELSHADTLIDVVAVSQAMNDLGIEKASCGAIPFGRGTISTAHGIIPNPPPAVTEILQGYPVIFVDEPLELVTPTGAAIVKHFVPEPRWRTPFTVTSSGYGVGTYEASKPDVLRVFVGTTTDETGGDDYVWVLETDLDDMETEYVGAVADRLRADGALDVLYFPVFMKKGRPGLRFSVIAPETAKERIMERLMTETSTFGLRMRREERRVLGRSTVTMDTPFGPVRVKQGLDRDGTVIKTHIEFDDVRALAETHDIPFRTMVSHIRRLLNN